MNKMDPGLYQEVVDVWPAVVDCQEETGPRLSGLPVFSDFQWQGSKQFFNGQNLSKVARDTCRHGKKVALLLTNTNVQDVIETPSWHLFVLSFAQCRKRWLSEGAAHSYIWKDRLAGMEAVAAAMGAMGGDDRDFLFAEFTTADGVARYLAHQPERWGQVVQAYLALEDSAADNVDVGGAQNDTMAVPDTALHALQQATNFDPEVVKAVCALATRMDGDSRRRLLEEVAAAEGGITDLTLIFGDSLDKRLRELEQIAVEYEDKIKHSGETAMQAYIEGRPWLLGLEYAGTYGRRDAGDGFIDFLLRRHDGGYDIVEMKGPEHLAIEPFTSKTTVTPPSKLRLGDELSNAIAQALNYKHIVQQGDLNKGIVACRDPKIWIVLGTSENIEGIGNEVFSQLKEILHHVEIINYDFVGKRALGIVDGMRKYLKQPVQN